MNKITPLAAALAAGSLRLHAAVHAGTMSKADDRVAIEKCDALADDAKDNCIAAAKVRFGQK